MRPASKLVAVAFGALAACGVWGCQDLAPAAEYTCPDREIFESHVSELMERRCGTLDCHGNAFRSMRLYGELGLRHPQELNRSGGVSTTSVERLANYRAVCAVEPEKVSEVAQDPGGQSVNRLLLVRKARGQEGHKGGKVLNPFDEGDLCIVGWLRGDNERSVREACEASIARLP